MSLQREKGGVRRGEIGRLGFTDSSSLNTSTTRDLDTQPAAIRNCTYISQGQCAVSSLNIYFSGVFHPRCNFSIQKDSYQYTHFL